MTRLEKKKNSLKALEARMAGLEAEKKRLEREVASIDRQRETKREILRTYRAGQIFKEAGILDFYNHDEVLQVLLQYREKYLATHPARQGQADERGHLAMEGKQLQGFHGPLSLLHPGENQAAAGSAEVSWLYRSQSLQEL